MEEEDISRNSDCDHPDTNHKSSTRGAKPYVNNQNYLSTVYNVDDDRTITSQSNRNDPSSNGSGSHDTEQDNDNQNPIDISDSNSGRNSEASQLSLGQQLSVGGYSN
jgi:hypothetical protein